MKKITIIYIFSLIALLITINLCSCDSKIHQINIDDKLKLIETQQFFTLAELNPILNWDSVYIVGPYNISFREKIKMTERDKSNIEYISKSNDGYCTFIFIKKGELVSYAFVPRANCFGCVDFVMLNDKFIYRDQKLFLDQKKIKIKE